MSYLTRQTKTPQSAPLAGQTPNSAGGFAWAVDDWARLRRFLILGSEGGSYYAGEWKLTRENAAAVERCLAADGIRAVKEIVAISDAGRAPKNDPAIFALAMAAGAKDGATRKIALEALPQVCRTGTHLFQFVSFVEGFRGWGRSLRRAVGCWYASRSAEGMTHRDVLRLAHPAVRVGSGNPTLELGVEHTRLFEWIVRGGETAGLPRIVEGFTLAQAAETPEQTAALVREYHLPREAVLTEHLRSPEVWAALLEDMPMTALIRNLATMTRVGVVAPGSAGTSEVVAQLRDRDRIRKARVHPIAFLAALRTYAAGRGVRGRHGWTPVTAIIDALDATFYTAFENVEPTGKRLLLALDVSGSMTSGAVGGVPSLTPRDASAALALVTAATETRYEVVGFCDGLKPLAISPRQRLDDAVRTVSNLPFGSTDCSQPMLYALDSFSIADPQDPGMLDVVGFDTATPQLVSDFARGAL